MGVQHSCPDLLLCELLRNVIQYHQSFERRDYKAWAQMEPFIIFLYLDEHDKRLWLALSNIGINT